MFACDVVCVRLKGYARKQLISKIHTALQDTLKLKSDIHRISLFLLHWGQSSVSPDCSNGGARPGSNAWESSQKNWPIMAESLVGARRLFENASGGCVHLAKAGIGVYGLEKRP